MSLQDRLGLILTPEIMNNVCSLQVENINEIRLRIGKNVSIVIDGKNFMLDKIVDERDINYTVEKATCSSLHSHSDEIRRGYIDFRGFRIGICGSAIYQNNELASYTKYSSLNIRVPHDKGGILDGLINDVIPFKNTLIVSPPGTGKTTALREMIKLLSAQGYRICVVDERNEIAAKDGLYPHFDLGNNTDIMTGVNKNEAMSMLIRAMNPEIIALDEIMPTDLIQSAAYNGARLLATAHANDENDADRLGFGWFDRILKIKIINGERVYSLCTTEH